MIFRINKLQYQLNLLDQEQHTQNKDIVDLLKYRNESVNTIVQHAEILTYLCEQDASLKKIIVPYSGIVGQA